MSTSIKAGRRSCRPGEIVFFRSFFADLSDAWRCSAWRGELRTALSTGHPFSHIARGVVGVAAMGLGFFALTRLPLPEAITLNYAQPLLVVVFSALFLGETIRVYRWSAVAIGLVGVLIISWPKLTLFGVRGRRRRPRGDRRRRRRSPRRRSRRSRCCWCGGWCAPRRSATIVLWFSLTASVDGAAVDPVRLAGADAWRRRRC